MHVLDGTADTVLRDGSVPTLCQQTTTTGRTTDKCLSLTSHHLNSGRCTDARSAKIHTVRDQRFRSGEATWFRFVHNCPSRHEYRPTTMATKAVRKRKG